jgi:hypothetical protein
MEDEHLPDDAYELIVVGTGLIECIVAGAAARVGRKVLHLDPQDYYGGDWASLSLDDLAGYVRRPRAFRPAEEHPRVLAASAGAVAEEGLTVLEPPAPGPECAPRFLGVEEWRTPPPPVLSEAEAAERVRQELGLEHWQVRSSPPSLPPLEPSTYPRCSQRRDPCGLQQPCQLQRPREHAPRSCMPFHGAGGSAAVWGSSGRSRRAAVFIVGASGADVTAHVRRARHPNRLAGRLGGAAGHCLGISGVRGSDSRSHRPGSGGALPRAAVAVGAECRGSARRRRWWADG